MSMILQIEIDKIMSNVICECNTTVDPALANCNRCMQNVGSTIDNKVICMKQVEALQKEYVLYNQVE